MINDHANRRQDGNQRQSWAGYYLTEAVYDMGDGCREWAWTFFFLGRLRFELVGIDSRVLDEVFNVFYVRVISSMIGDSYHHMPLISNLPH